jgi:nucleoside-diphosphate-sugar epimerase
MKALVTGANGFLGRRLVARLQAEDVRVRALVRGTTAGRKVAADEVHEGDLQDSSALERAVRGIDVVFHAGARVQTTGSWEEFKATNVRATEALIRIAQAAGVERVVHVSSLSVYAVPRDGAVILENGSYDPEGSTRGFYARSKLEADRLAMQAAGHGSPVTVVRPGLLYGPGRPPPLARRAISLGPLRLLLAHPCYLLPLAYVDNVADALLLAARSSTAAGRAYSIVDEHVCQRDYTRLYKRVSGERWVAVNLPVRMLVRLAGILEASSRRMGLRPPVTRHQIERSTWSATYSTDRAQRELGWRPGVRVEEGLRRTFGCNSDDLLPSAREARSAA